MPTRRREGVGVSDKKWVVDVSEDERELLLALPREGKVAAQRARRAHILLHVDEGRTDDAIAEALHTNRSTVERTRRHFVEEGLEAALSERPRPEDAHAEQPVQEAGSRRWRRSSARASVRRRNVRRGPEASAGRRRA
jgi:Homeodomain-like domain